MREQQPDVPCKRLCAAEVVMHHRHDARVRTDAQGQLELNSELPFHVRHSRYNTPTNRLLSQVVQDFQRQVPPTSAVPSTSSAMVLSDGGDIRTAADQSLRRSDQIHK